MSWRATAFIKTIRENLTRSEKLVLLILADYHNDETGQCDPSLQRLATDCLSSKRNIIRILQSLERKGFLAICERFAERQNTSNQYDLSLGDIVSLPPKADQNVTRGSDTSVTRVVTKSKGGSDTSVTRGSDIAMSPKPSSSNRNINRNINRKSEPQEHNTNSNVIPAIKVTEEYALQLCDEYAHLWSSEATMQRIEEAENYYAGLIRKGKYQDINLCVRSWLRKDAESGSKLKPPKYREGAPGPKQATGVDQYFTGQYGARLKQRQEEREQRQQTK